MKAWAALVVTLVQCVMLFATPIASCCGRSAPMKAETNKVDQECCPPGSHPPGQCPLHKNKTSRKSSTDCRIRCDAEDAPALLAGAAAVLTASATSVAPSPASPFRFIVRAIPLTRGDFPDAPPPRAL